ncbi:Rho guanine nucleotide exchange factor 12 [Hypsibius exemplaris]|uniref:Rho guanine nucleotide exchange factor 12 n=1 Tax=Hypsibius exemplaris TaxID=2072580 RepID=A0A1W0X307_HYPEX|nr:Rho guanine nucleotide exchange factor 12 [Hypsibius exemplaris]
MDKPQQRRGAVKRDNRLTSSPKTADIIRGGIQDTGDLISTVFQRDNNGYGLTVSGDNPVFVQSVTPNGSAAMAGLQTGDRIIKVNGKLVTDENHTGVVDLIKSETHVAMTVFRTYVVTIPPAAGATTNGNHQLMNPAYSNGQDHQRELSTVEEVQKKPPANGPKSRTQPPTPPPIERIPGYQDDASFRGSRTSTAPTGLHRRRSNPEVVHAGVNRMALTSAQSIDQIVTVDQLHRQNSFPDELPPALPVKRGRNANNSLQDVSDFVAPSGTPPPPYPGDGQQPLHRSSQRVVPKSGSFSGMSAGPLRVQQIRQVNVMTAEEHTSFSISQGPFSDYSTLQRSLPHLAVFINYLFQPPSDDVVALLFHLITDIYPKGTSKEILRWAFEIHFTFIVPNSPLDLLNNVPCGDKNPIDIVNAIDEVLAKPDREDVLRDVFTSARLIALHVIKARLAEFQQKRIQGLHTLFTNNLTDIELEEAVHAPDKMREVMDRVLVGHLEAITVASPGEPENRSDRQAAIGCALATFLKVNGVKAMGRDGSYLVDKWPLLVQKDKSKFKLKDKSKKAVNVSGHQFASVSFTSLNFCVVCNTVLWGVGPQGLQCTSCEFTSHRGCLKNVEEMCVGEKKERRSFINMDSFGIFGRKRSNNSPTAIANAKKGHDEKEEADVIGDVLPDNRDEPKGYVNQVVNRFESGKMQDPSNDVAAIGPTEKAPKVPLTVVGRSESLKAQKKAQIKPGVRKKSDPAHFHRDDMDDLSELNGKPLAVSGSSSVSMQSLPSDSSLIFEDDPDFDADPDHIPNWQSMLTDPSVVEALGVHHLEEMIQIHVELNEQMKVLKSSGTLIGNVGDMLLSRFAGHGGKVFKNAAAAFNHNQPAALEVLKNSQVKNPKLVKFLEEAASNPLCRRLMLKDIIPTGMQRLTKYPLLLENLVKYTPGETDEEKAELKKVQVALESSREILNYVNQAIHDSANIHRLKELQSKIDMAPYLKSQHKRALDSKDLELSKYCLLFDGDLTWRLSKQKTVDLHVILLNKMLLLVTKQDDKLVLKYHASPVTVVDSSKKPTEKPWGPILSLDGLSVRDVATDPRAFFLFQCTSSGFSAGPQMYEMVANSDKEQKLWKKYILEAISRVSHDYESIRTAYPTSATASITVPLPIISAETESGIHAQSDDDDALQNDAARNAHLERLTLTSPSDVIVTEPFVLEDAKVVVSSMEQLRRSDEQVEEGLTAKLRLVSEILGISAARSAGGEDSTQPPDGKRLMHRLMTQTGSLIRLLKDSLTISVLEDELDHGIAMDHGESSVRDAVDSPVVKLTSVSVQTIPALQPGVPLEDLQPLVANLNSDLSTLMRYLCDKDAENERLRAQLATAKELLVSARTESRSPTPIGAVAPRPDSRISFLSLHSESEIPQATDSISVESVDIPLDATTAPADAAAIEESAAEPAALAESHHFVTDDQEEVQHL